jgi:hypothetical protein
MKAAKPAEEEPVEGSVVDQPQPGIILLVTGRQYPCQLLAVNSKEVKAVINGRNVSYPANQVRGVQTRDNIFMYNQLSGAFESAKDQMAQFNPNPAPLNNPAPQNDAGLVPNPNPAPQPQPQVNQAPAQPFQPWNTNPNPAPNPPFPQTGMNTPNVATSPPPTFQTTEKCCSKCRKPVPANAKAGDTCPHCGITWDYEEGADGKVVSWSSNYRTGKIVGGIVGFVIVIVGLLVKLFR